MNGDCDEKDGKIREIEKEKTLLEYCEILLRSLSSGYCLLLISQSYARSLLFLSGPERGASITSSEWPVK